MGSGCNAQVVHFQQGINVIISPPPLLPNFPIDFQHFAALLVKKTGQSAGAKQGESDDPPKTSLCSPGWSLLVLKHSGPGSGPSSALV